VRRKGKGRAMGSGADVAGHRYMLSAARTRARQAYPRSAGSRTLTRVSALRSQPSQALTR